MLPNNDLSFQLWSAARAVDPLERQVRDPIRKLGRHDRLVGAACLALEYGIRPDNLALGIAAALQYANPQDPSAVKLQALIESGGLEAVFTQVCEIEPEGELARLVKARRPDLEKFRQPA